MNETNAGEIVSQVGKIYADLSEKDELVKPLSALPCSWFAARDAFMTAYEAEFCQMSEEIKNSFGHVYKELAFFVDDLLCNSFNASLIVAVKYRHGAYGKLVWRKMKGFPAIL